ncbi:hypothetical protein INT45_013091 [Circinella minor]|uniref:Helitron helicase-like domain-containing protein n=1 Tax=Circinella minor TaxID=1195481 RepID=A0A8H7RS00_9FUNG|nr:hypothetical protein INT45_013091 [Circinella minor]
MQEQLENLEEEDNGADLDRITEELNGANQGRRNNVPSAASAPVLPPPFPTRRCPKYGNLSHFRATSGSYPFNRRNVVSEHGAQFRIACQEHFEPENIFGYYICYTQESRFYRRHIFPRKINLPIPRSPPQELLNLITNHDPTNALSVQLHTNIRAYDSLFAFASVRANYDPQLASGRDGTIQTWITQHNPFVHTLLRTASEAYANQTVGTIQVVIRAARDMGRRYDVPAHPEVAAMVVENTTDGSVLLYDVDIHDREHGLQQVSSLHPSYTPLHYVLMFSYGNNGWYLGLRSISTATNDDTNVTLLNHCAYMMMIQQGERETYHHHFGRLFQQFLVDNYVRIETAPTIEGPTTQTTNNRATTTTSFSATTTTAITTTSTTSTTTANDTNTTSTTMANTTNEAMEIDSTATSSINNTEQPAVNEITQYQNARYIGPCEAVWCTLGFLVHMHYPTVIRLNLHLPNDQIVYFRGDMDEQELNRAKEAARGTYTNDDQARQYCYHEIPAHYT